MYYRVAVKLDSSPVWQWKSTVLGSQNLLLQWLQYYRALPHDRLRIFSSSSREELHEQLMRENQGLGSSSVPAAQFLQDRRITPREVVREASAGGARDNERSASIAAVSEPPQGASGRSPLDKRREELEHGAGGDHNLSYRFTLPTSTPQVLAWLKLLVRVQQGDLQQEVVGFRRGTHDVDPAYQLATRV